MRSGGSIQSCAAESKAATRSNTCLCTPGRCAPVRDFHCLSALSYSPLQQDAQHTVCRGCTGLKHKTPLHKIFAFQEKQSYTSLRPITLLEGAALLQTKCVEFRKRKSAAAASRRGLTEARDQLSASSYRCVTRVTGTRQSSVLLPTLTHTRTCGKNLTHQDPTRVVRTRRNREAQRSHQHLHTTKVGSSSSQTPIAHINSGSTTNTAEVRSALPACDPT